MFALKGVNYKDILHYPDMEIPAEATSFISGESGSGKSTLLKLLNGVLSPTKGKISYLGKSVEEYDPIHLRREVLLVSQSAYLFDKSIKENFQEFYAYRDIAPLDEERMKHYLEIAAADLPLDSMCQLLSGGERQRVFLAINLSFGSKVLMLDEPTSALDDKTAHLLIENTKAHCKAENTALIIVSHDQAIAETYADHLIRLAGGAAR